MFSLENPWEFMKPTQTDLTKMESSTEPTNSPATAVYASVARAISEISDSQQNHGANVEIATKR